MADPMNTTGILIGAFWGALFCYLYFRQLILRGKERDRMIEAFNNLFTTWGCPAGAHRINWLRNQLSELDKLRKEKSK